MSEEEAERHLDEMFGDNRCSFCGKRADQIHKLIKKDAVSICDICIDELYELMHGE